jgi:hypothetical protein
MKKTLLGSILLVLALVLGAGLAAAQTPAPACQAAAPSLEAIQAPAAVPVPAGLFAPQAEEKAICPLIGCVNDEYCRRDRDCSRLPGGVCNLFCPTQGCCSYPG